MRPLILICDISGSMDRYSRLLLQFVHALEHGLDAVEVFVFSTRLTRITRELRKRNVDAAIEHVVKSVDDWSGGTRIGEAIKDIQLQVGAARAAFGRDGGHDLGWLGPRRSEIALA